MANLEKNQDAGKKSSSHGGARPNAGRKKGAVTVKTREIADKVMSEAGEGNTPLEVMLDIMKRLREAALKAMESESDDERKAGIRLAVMAKDAASAAAPYVHPRLTAIDHTTNGKDMAQTSGVLVAPPAQSEEEWEKGDGSA